VRPRFAVLRLSMRAQAGPAHGGLAAAVLGRQPITGMGSSMTRRQSSLTLPARRALFSASERSPLFVKNQVEDFP